MARTEAFIDQVVIALDDLNFDWSRTVTVKVRRMWDEGYSLEAIARECRGDTDEAKDETALLLMHLARQGKIKRRTTGVWGKGA